MKLTGGLRKLASLAVVESARSLTQALGGSLIVAGHRGGVMAQDQPAPDGIELLPANPKSMTARTESTISPEHHGAVPPPRSSETEVLSDAAPSKTHDQEPLTFTAPGATERLWDWAKHEDNLFMTRFSGFLTAHGLLVTAVGLAYQKQDTPTLFLVVTSAFGLLLGGVWLVLQRQGAAMIRKFEDALKLYDPAFKEVNATIFASKDRSLNATRELAWIVPGGVLLMWLALLLLFLKLVPS